MSKRMEYQVVYASDDNFAEILGVSIVSLFENNKDASDIRLTILEQQICEENRRKIESICIQYGRSLPKWLPVVDLEKQLNLSIQLDRGSISQYSRIFMGSLLPEEIDRVISLDCDVIINQSIGELWNMDLQEHTIGVLMDAFSKYYRVNIELEPEDIMFNPGVMVIDLKKWRENQVEKKSLDFICRHKGRIQQCDLGVLNSVLSKDAYCFEPRFNSLTIFYDFTYEEMMIYRRPPQFYTKEEVKTAVEEPVIIHFTTSFLSNRPWVEHCEHRYKYKWDTYKAMSPWADAPDREDKKSVWKKTALVMFQVLPRRVSVWLVSLLQVYARPWKNRLMDLVRR